ncbi:hypothetical protein [Thermosediminibacter litoriperuensis]|uniref:DUF7916 domain-containing protein n=1 Tax=Thermosediminibacter litoriperuensis TaxID=291989 RepID=A0A5S5AR85_9FIRM|nr:hypothetical protein [Thermosediminibacter litoriperuensis]TYP54202.1 hypothetical protein LZ11_01412 [Thermosediminibacter litoriperuensis]
MKRIFELGFNDVINMDKTEILACIKASEGRTVMAETIVAVPPLIYGVSNPELAAACGADMVTLNFLDLKAPFIFGIDDNGIDLNRGAAAFEEVSRRSFENGRTPGYAKKVKDIVGRFIGVNLEPVPDGMDYPAGRKLDEANLRRALEMGFDYIVITGNPNTGVTDGGILKGIETASEILVDRVIIIAGKMHCAGGENIYDPEVLKDFAKAGADVVLIPAPGTVPGMDLELAKRQVEAIHQAGALAMTAIGTSQEGAGADVVEQMALMSKMAGVDIQHIGDAGYSGIALPENIMALSIAIRGKRHTYRRMAYSIRK